MTSKNYTDLASTESVARRVRQAIDQSGRTKVELARLLGCTPQALHEWQRTGRISKGKLSALADLTRVSLTWLMHGGGAPEVKTDSAVYRLPIQSWAGGTSGSTLRHMTVVSRNPISQNAYVLPVEGDAMSGEFAPGTSIVVDPDAIPKPGHFVVASVRGDPPILRRLERDGGACALVASNPAYPAITCTDDELTVLGVVVQAIREL